MANNETPPTFRTLDVSAEAKKIWGPKWNEAETAYEFSNGRKFKLRTEDGATYAGAAGAPRLFEDGSLRLTEEGAVRLME